MEPYSKWGRINDKYILSKCLERIEPLSIFRGFKRLLHVTFSDDTLQVVDKGKCLIKDETKVFMGRTPVKGFPIESQITEVPICSTGRMDDDSLHAFKLSFLFFRPSFQPI
jgi:hypothetical protein